jgi:hypothetical protein
MTLMTVSVIAPAAAAAQPQWTLRLRGLYSDYTRDSRIGYFSSTSRVEFDRGEGVEVAAEYRSSPRIGVELSASRLRLDARYHQLNTRPISFDPLVFEEREVFTDSGHFDLEPIALALLIHPWPARRVDFYVGPQIAFTQFNVAVEGIPDRDSEFAYGGKLGAELRLGDSPWTAGLDLRHLQVVHEATDRDIYANIGINVLSFGFGLHLGGGSRR